MALNDLVNKATSFLAGGGTTTINGITPNNRQQYETGAGTTEYFETPEMRALMARFADPLTLNFKVMVDWDKPYGLVSAEANVNSALAYLKRIGEEDRYNMLKQWIELFKILVREYDFLFLNSTGLDEIATKKPHESFKEEDSKVSFELRETADMMCQSLVTMYRHICFDCNVRGVEVIPANLRRLDMMVLVYSSGYYNMALYDVLENNGLTNDDYETKMFPTLKKLSKGFFVENSDTYDFNHHMFIMGDASFNVEESGKSFFERVSNEPGGDFTRTNFVFNFRFASYKGVFNNLFGEFDLVKVLALAAAQDKVSNDLSSTSKQNSFAKVLNTAAGNVKSYLPKLGDSIAKAGVRELNKLARKPAKYLNGLIGENSIIGSSLMKFTDPDYAVKMLENTVDLGIQNIENKYVYDNIAKINNMVFKGFSDNFMQAYDNWVPTGTKNPTGLLEQQPKINPSTGQPFNTAYNMPEVEKGIRQGQSRNQSNVNTPNIIYSRRGF
jgi:hypothetical protein